MKAVETITNHLHDTNQNYRRGGGDLGDAGGGGPAADSASVQSISVHGAPDSNFDTATAQHTLTSKLSKQAYKALSHAATG